MPIDPAMPDLSKEISRFPQSDPGPDPIHIGIVYPNTYPVAIASLGFQTVHLLAHSHPGVVTHRIVLEKDNGRDYPSRTLEENLEVRSLAALLISCSFELDYLHLVRILDEAGIPVLRKNRRALPLIIAGGIAPTANPEPLALIADAISIGEAEKILPAILDDLHEAWPLIQGPRFIEGREMLYELWDRRPGVYVPDYWENLSDEFDDRDGHRLHQASIDDLNEHQSYTPIISPDGVYGAKNLVGISSGCHAGCRFCLLRHVFPPGPHRSLESVLENARRFNPDEASVGLVSSRVSDHPDLVDIIDTLTDEGYVVSVSSLRVATTSPEILSSLARSGARSVTFAPEHGSSAIRDLIGKPHTYAQIADRVKWAYSAGIPRVKLYFITGFAEETEADLDATIEFVESLATDAGLSGLPPESRLIVGLAPFVPKASTPFQRRAMEDEKTLRGKINRISQALKNHPRIEIETESPRMAVIQGALSIADRRIGLHLADIAKTRGPLPSSWDEALQNAGDWPRKNVMNSRDESASLPWTFIERPQRTGGINN